MKNDYYDIAYNDLLYLEDDYYKTNYNPMVVQIQQVAEKMLNSVLVLVSTNETLFHSHNLRQIYDAIHELQSDFVLDRMELAYLKDFYFEAKYPGDNFVVVSREECATCLHIMYSVITAVTEFRRKAGLDYYDVVEKYLEEPSGDNKPKKMNI